MTTKREFAYLVGGVGLGIYVPRLLPKTKAVKAGKYIKEVISARMRLQKVLIENYHQIDGAIESEEAFLNMINPGIKLTSPKVSFSVRDDAEGQRSIRLHIGPTPNS